jgi:transcriptional regulator with XRE-family HTH domain
MNDPSKQLEIGQRIRGLRKECKISQASLAKRLRRDQTTISDLERGKIGLTPLMSFAICSFFAVREEWLLNGTGAKYENKKQLLEEKARELGQDIWDWFRHMKAAYDLRREAAEVLLSDRLTVSAYDELADPELTAIIAKIVMFCDSDVRRQGVIKVLEALEMLVPGTTTCKEEINLLVFRMENRNPD